MIPAAIVDRAPETEEERGMILGALLDQLRQLGEAADARVTCPCGHETRIGLAAKCHHCGLWFCRSCADRHFGPAPVSPFAPAPMPGPHRPSDQETCLAHLQPEPCPVCASYIAAGL